LELAHVAFSILHVVFTFHAQTFETTRVRRAGYSFGGDPWEEATFPGTYLNFFQAGEDHGGKQ